ncbi:hypothetical protein [Holdemania sp. 1001302B_160321_E10]|uniref:hypothetical protein n=1 Tax=Holdemania sp. 1001302B_160321_E10 TaxID=2787120 RepID=UPI0018997CDD|nr:hypothetical protein [Holdemania sp. 1001302B_160321_E10]
MKSLNDKLKSFQSSISEISTCYHYFRPVHQEAPFIVWAENGEGSSFYGGNRKEEQTIAGIIDLFTKEEFDPRIDEIQDFLFHLPSFELESVQYEEETELIHYEWSFEI